MELGLKGLFFCQNLQLGGPDWCTGQLRRAAPARPCRGSAARRAGKLHGVRWCARRTENVPRTCAVAVPLVSMSTKKIGCLSILLHRTGSVRSRQLGVQLGASRHAPGLPPVQLNAKNSRFHSRENVSPTKSRADTGENVSPTKHGADTRPNQKPALMEGQTWCRPGMNHFLGCKSCDSPAISLSSCLREAGERGGREGCLLCGTRRVSVRGDPPWALLSRIS